MCQATLIGRTLSHCGYQDDPTEANLKECFLDYVNGGVFGDLDLDEAKEMLEAGEITVEVICRNLLKLKNHN
jgi:hypothetical protein